MEKNKIILNFKTHGLLLKLRRSIKRSSILIEIILQVLPMFDVTDANIDAFIPFAYNPISDKIC